MTLRESKSKSAMRVITVKVQRLQLINSIYRSCKVRPPDIAAILGKKELTKSTFGQPYVRVAIGDDISACREVIRPNLALYIGGMKNFYDDLAKRMGYEAPAATIPDHDLAGRRQEAEAAVPDALIDETSLVGPKERVREGLPAWQQIAKDHRVGPLVLASANLAALRVVAEAVL
jgi:alkanesulfonate monooxygenase SsuD/methylene tetrahydromethanopterin reductase-like flavin-dependent oxidoreductase (luciferase family)